MVVAALLLAVAAAQGEMAPVQAGALEERPPP
jgi:hypothetical protein